MIIIIIIYFLCVFLLSQKKAKQGPLHITVGELLRLSKECPYSNVPFGLAVVVSLFLSALHVVVNLSVCSTVSSCSSYF